jgi:hypothetical protein
MYTKLASIEINFNRCQFCIHFIVKKWRSGLSNASVDDLCILKGYFD